jgi:hypothetical protein
MEGYQSWIRLTKVDVVGLLIFLLYLGASVVYLLARIVYSLDGLGSELWYGAVVLSAEILSVLSLIFYGIWLCAKTNNDDLKVKSFDSEKMRRLYTVRVFILARHESLSLVRRTIASVKNAYMPDGCELKLYLLDDTRDNVKRDFFMGMKTGADVIYITPPVRNESTKVRRSARANGLPVCRSSAYVGSPCHTRHPTHTAARMRVRCAARAAAVTHGSRCRQSTGAARS